MEIAKKLKLIEILEKIPNKSDFYPDFKEKVSSMFYQQDRYEYSLSVPFFVKNIESELENSKIELKEYRNRKEKGEYSKELESHLRESGKRVVDLEYRKEKILNSYPHMHTESFSRIKNKDINSSLTKEDFRIISRLLRIYEKLKIKQN
jgi:hypothetical protein